MAHNLEVLAINYAIVPILHEQAAIHAFEISSDTGRRPRSGAEQAYVFLTGHSSNGFRRYFRCNNHFDKLSLDDGRRSFAVERSVESDNAAKGRFGIGVKGEVIGGQQVGAAGDAAGIGVFHNDAGGLAEGFDALERGIGIRYVIVGECFALELFCRADAHLSLLGFSVKSGALMGVFTVAHLLHFLQLQVKGAGIASRAPLGQTAKVVGDHAVVSRRVLVRADRQIKSHGRSGVSVVFCEL